MYVMQQRYFRPINGWGFITNGSETKGCHLRGSVRAILNVRVSRWEKMIVEGSPCTFT